MNHLRFVLVGWLLTISQALPAQLFRLENLEGIEAFQVIVMELKPEIERQGLTAIQIKKDVEEKLESAGITVSNDPDTPFIYVAVNVYQDKATMLYPFSVSMTVNHLVDLKGETIWAKIWMTSFVALTDDVKKLRRMPKEIIDKLIDDYQTANPK